MLRSEVTGHRPRGLPRRCVRVRERHWKESEEGELLLNGRESAHALDAMRHWRDPEERLLRALRRRRRTLIDDNPPSG
jgi:hypothetical protein